MKFFLTLLFLFPVLLFSQPAMQWQKCLGGMVDDYATHSIQTSDGSYVIVGAAYSSDGDVSVNYGDTDYWIVKLDGNGNLLWQKTYGGSGTDQPNYIAESSDGGFLILGASSSLDGDVSFSYGNFDVWLIKLDVDGNLLWEKSYGGSDSDQGNCVIESSDLGIVITGFSYSSDGNLTVNNGLEDFWTVKTDNSGNILWQVSNGGSQTDIANSVVQASDGTYLVFGYTNSTDGDISSNLGSYDYWLLNLDTDGSLLWEKTYGGTSDDWGNSVRVSATDIFITGSSPSADGQVTGAHGSYDTWTCKLDNAGNISWESNYGSSGDDRSYSSFATSDGGVIIVGVSNATGGDVSANYGSYDFWCVKMNSDGSMAWEKNFGGTSEDWSNSVNQTADGGYIISGYSRSTDVDVSGNHGSFGGADYWVFKLEGTVVTKTWTGFNGSNWNDPLNWNPNGVPAFDEDVIIPVTLNNPVVSSDQNMKNLQILPNAALTINTGFSLNINGNFFMGSDATGTASLIDDGVLNVLGTSNIQLYLSAQKHYVSSPSAGVLADVYNGSYLDEYYEPGAYWNSLLSADPMEVMTGYVTEFLDGLPHTVVYNMPVNTGLHSVVLENSNTGDPMKDGWNLVGNPYPSAINWDSPGIQMQDIDSVVYLWNGVQYATYGNGISTNGATAEIPAMQGFFVKSTNASGGSFGMDNTARIHSSQGFYKSTPSVLKLQLQSALYSDDLIIHYGQNNAYQLYGLPEVPTIYTEANNSRYTVLGIEPFEVDTSINVFFYSGESANFTINFVDVGVFGDTVECKLYDAYIDTFIVAEQAAHYSFYTDSGTYENRFSLLLRQCSNAEIIIDQDQEDLCEGDVALLSAITNVDHEYIQWYLGSGYFLEDSVAEINIGPFLSDSSFSIVCSVDAGCGNITSDTVQFSIHQSDVVYNAFGVCINDSIQIVDSWYHSDTLIVDTLVNLYGCDSIIQYQIETHDVFADTSDYYLCEGDSVFLLGEWINSEQVISDTAASLFGCDSIQSMHVYIMDVFEPQLGVDTVLCAGSGQFELSPGIYTQYLWNDLSADESYIFDTDTNGLGNHEIWIEVIDQNGCVSSDTIQIELDACLQNFSLEKDRIELYPNPAEILVHIINAGSLHYMLYNTLGEVVQDGNISNENYILDVSDLGQGVYLIVITGMNQCYTQKLLVR